MTTNTPSERRLNPLVDRYVTTDLSLLDIARTATRSHQLVNALLMVHESLMGKRLARDAIAAAREVQIKGSDPELMILMLSSWAELSSSLGRPSETEALVHRAQAMISESTHALVRAYALFAEAVLSNSKGDKVSSEKVLRNILEIVPEHSPRRKFYTWELCLFLAQQGRTTEYKKELEALTWQCTERFDLSRILLVQFVDAVETGRVRKASELMPRIANASQTKRQLTRIPYRGYQLLLFIMHNAGRPLDAARSRSAGPAGLPETDLSGPALRRPGRPAVHEDGSTNDFMNAPTTPDWIRVVDRLLHRDSAHALKLARQQANRVLSAIMGSGFDSFSLVRAELAAGHAEAARHLLNLRQSRGNPHYLDHFFLARVELLEGNPTLAAAAFSELLRSVDFYGAKGRLDFEMKLACELSHGDIVQLTQAAGRMGMKRKNLPTQSATSSQPGMEPITEPAKRRLEHRIVTREKSVNAIIGRSTQTRQIRETILRFADLDTPVLITGETGTGKDLIARSLHNASRKRHLPFTPVNCSSITETLLESELFGYERGAFTGAEKTTKGLFEATGNGVIFLDEIGDISPRLQQALLRVLETGEIRAVGSTSSRQINCRIITATNANLESIANAGSFRRDLLYRLQRLMIHIPPLRERPNDILPLVRHFLDMDRRVGVHATLSPSLTEAIKAYDWPGNVRELKNVVERMRLMHSDKLSYDVEDLDIKFQSLPSSQPVAPTLHPTSAEGTEAEPRRTPTVPPSAREQENPSGDVHAFLKTGRSQLRRLDRLRELFNEHGKMTRTEIIQILSVSPNTATKDLKTLCEEGFIQRVEPSASTRSHYFVRTTDAPETP